MFDEERFGDDGPSTTRSKQARDCCEKVDENYGGDCKSFCVTAYH